MRSLYDAEEAGFNPDVKPWVTYCEDHGYYISHDSQQAAEMQLASADWCSDCQEELEGN